MKLSERTVKRNEIQSYNVYTMFPKTKKHLRENLISA